MESSKAETRPNGGVLVAEALGDAGVELVFSLNGGHVGPIYDACIDRRIRIVDVRHEEAAGHMAHAYSRVGRHMGVAVVSAGPGVTNIVTAVANAYQAGAPLLVIGGKAPLRQFEMGALQDIPQVEIMAPITKWARTVLETRRIGEYVAEGLRRARSGRPGPVYLEIPTDVLRRDVEAGDVVPTAGCEVEGRSSGDPEVIARAAELLRQARRPLVVVGSGVGWSGAEQELAALLDTTGFPVITTSAAKGSVPADHPQLVAGARSAALSGADVVLVVGTRLNFVMGYGRPPRFAAGAKVVQIDIDPVELGRNRRVEVGIAADARMGLAQLTEALADSSGPESGEWLDTLRDTDRTAREALDGMRRSDATPVHPLRLCAEVARAVGEDGIVAADGGDIFSFARVGIDTYRPGHWLEPGVFGCLGVGVPFAVAAKIARPEQRVACITGDGAFGLTGLELDTAVRHDVPIVVVISNNAAWAIERASQIRDYGPDRVIGTDLLPTRYDLMAQALGCHGELAERPEELAPALERAFASGRPACVNVMTDPNAVSPDSARGLAVVPDDQPLGWRAGRVR